MNTPPFTIDDIRREFRARGLTVTQWASQMGFSRDEVYALLNGRTRGNWGRSHAIAVALGLKTPPISDGLLACIEPLRPSEAMRKTTEAEGRCSEDERQQQGKEVKLEG